MSYFMPCQLSSLWRRELRAPFLDENKLKINPPQCFLLQLNCGPKQKAFTILLHESNGNTKKTNSACAIHENNACQCVNIDINFNTSEFGTTLSCNFTISF